MPSHLTFFSIFIDTPDHLNDVSSPLKFMIEEMVDNMLKFCWIDSFWWLCFSIIDKGSFYKKVSANSFVPDQYFDHDLSKGPMTS